MTEEIKTYFIVKGEVTDPDVHQGNCKVGDIEWQFSDGPPGDRTMSNDFLSLEDGLRELGPAHFHFCA